MMTDKERTAYINKLQKRHPGTTRQRSYHGADRYSVQFFDKKTGKLVADYNIPQLYDAGNGRRVTVPDNE